MVLQPSVPVLTIESSAMMKWSFPPPSTYASSTPHSWPSTFTYCALVTRTPTRGATGGLLLSSLPTICDRPLMNTGATDSVVVPMTATPAYGVSAPPPTFAPSRRVKRPLNVTVVVPVDDIRTPCRSFRSVEKSVNIRPPLFDEPSI